jgi:hypothetical protein
MKRGLDNMGRVAKDNKLNEKILVDLMAGVSWTEIREKHGVDNAYISSVQGIHQTEININRGRDNEKPSAVKKFNINNMSDEELEKMGLLKYKKKA